MEEMCTDHELVPMRAPLRSLLGDTREWFGGTFRCIRLRSIAGATSVFRLFVSKQVVFIVFIGRRLVLG